MSKKHTIEEMQQIAESRGGRCLSDVYVNPFSKLLWQCAKGHQWMARPHDVQRGTWCRKCSGYAKLTIQAMQQFAESRGGRCLSDIYVGVHSKLTWQCAKGHQWTAEPSNIQQGHWCPQCYGNVKLTIQHMHRLAETRGGRCLSDDYTNANTPLLWQCKEGHQWEAIPDSVRRGSWCAKCSGKAKLTIQHMHRLAETRGGKCISDTYVDNKTPLRWECKEGHSWQATPGNIGMGQWCPQCCGNVKSTIDAMHRLARSRGGKCLSDTYVNNRAQLRWECKEGHSWQANARNIGTGRWCPICWSGLGERICREFFSQLLGHSFPRARPKWLVNKAGNQMELDGYCATLRIAFEHQGEQHFSTGRYFVLNQSDLLRRQDDDARKSDLCAQKGIALVHVPEIPNRLPIKKVRAFIKEQLSIKGVPLPPDFDTREVDFKKAYRISGSVEILNRLRTIATERGGQCLSTSYVSAKMKLLWQCAQGHKWEATSGNIQTGFWCPFCAGNIKKTIGEMKAIAAARGGKCLSEQYTNLRTKLLWECARRHQWKAQPASIVHEGTWCPKCAEAKRGQAQRLGLPAMQALAASRGGQCLSDEYVNSSTHLLWQCKEGHQWKAVPASVKSGSWCPVCGNRRKTGRPKASQVATSLPCDNRHYR